MIQQFPRRWDLKTQIDFLQRKIAINAIIYYEYNTNLMSDKDYDELSKQLVQLQSQSSDIMSTQYGYCFYDFDGTTGFDIFSRLNQQDKNYLCHIAGNLCNRFSPKAQQKPIPIINKKKGRLL